MSHDVRRSEPAVANLRRMFVDHDHNPDDTMRHQAEGGFA